MAELTMEQKAKAYDEAIERAKEHYHAGCFAPALLEYIFPELNEPEDERTRKELLGFIENWKNPNNLGRLQDRPMFTKNEEQCNKYIAWLEKQGENNNHNAWGEEDEKGLGDALWCCKQAASIAKDENDMGNAWYAEKWLKGLKPQNLWRPTEEQITALEHFVRDASPYDNDTKLIYSLLEQLKKL